MYCKHCGSMVKEASMRDYGFVLEFEDLPTDLIEEKIDKMIEFDYENGNVEAEDKDGNKISIDKYMKDRSYRKDCERDIADHFPIYF